jgi:hypothetical protein
MPNSVEFVIEQGDVTAFDADVLALKYAQGFHGVDEVVAESLQRVGVSISSLQPSNGQFFYADTHGCISAKHVLFVGVVRLRAFSYPQIREFAAEVLHILADQAPATGHLAMTMHGVGYGLDEVEACLAQVEGYLDALRAGPIPSALRRISIVDRDPGRVKRLRQAVAKKFAETSEAVPLASGGVYVLNGTPATQQTKRTVGQTEAGAATKPHIFVAMSFSKQLDDVFHYGIEGPVHTAGYLCERMDHVAFAGEIISWLKQRIETAEVVIAELTGSNPNVYLEIGYAWGKGRPTILLAPTIEELAFDVRGHRCLVYEGIQDLEAQLNRELASLTANKPT